jgi:hypothetical protein
MDDVRPSRPSMPSSVEKYVPGEAAPGSDTGPRKPSRLVPTARGKSETPEVEEDESRHQLDERA